MIGKALWAFMALYALAVAWWAIKGDGDDA